MSTTVTEYSIDISSGELITYPLPDGVRVLGFRQDRESTTNILLACAYRTEFQSNLMNVKLRFVPAGSTFTEPMMVVTYIANGLITDPNTSEITSYYLFKVLI